MEDDDCDCGTRMATELRNDTTRSAAAVRILVLFAFFVFDSTVSLSKRYERRDEIGFPLLYYSLSDPIRTYWKGEKYVCWMIH